MVMMVRRKFPTLHKQDLHAQQHECRRYEYYGQYHCFHCLLRI